jgi:hypothetical protein
VYKLGEYKAEEKLYREYGSNKVEYHWCRQSVGLLGRGISRPPGPTYAQQNEHGTNANFNASRHMYIIKTYCVAFSPQANYTDWSTATGQRILVPTFADRGGVSRGHRAQLLRPLISVF